ncbi:MAG: hypothetical protein ACYTFK_04765 [Planctomycetota bacterium]|jgi:hypothetical protein
MAIDITNNIVFEPGSSGIDPSIKQNTEKAAQTEAADSTLRTEYEPFIRRAAQLPEDDPQAVTDALKALESGQLDSPEAIQAAAENILKFGI